MPCEQGWPSVIRRRLRAAARVVLPLVVAWCAAVTASAQAPPAPRLRVLFLGDNGHHQPNARAKSVLPALAADGIDLFYTADPADLRADELRHYHALVLYNNHMTVAPDQLHALLQFVGKGGGLIALHCASASFQNAEAFVKVIGGAFKSHGTGTFSATRVAPDHPAIAGVPTFESWDETYVHTRHNPIDRTVLEVRREGDHEEPWTWVRPYGKGRVFYTAWGHDHRTWEQDGFKQLLMRGIRWSAGDWGLQARPKEPVPSLTNLPAPLPVYVPGAPWNTQTDPEPRGQVPLSVEDSLALTTLRPGFTIETFATDPMVRRVVDFTWDTRGRMWVVETNDYPNRVLPDGEPGGDRVLVLDDTNGDGKADKVEVFAEGLNLATSLVLARGGVIVAQAPHMLFLKDTNGDGKADERTTLFTGWPRTDTHGTPSNLRYGFDNQILGAVGYNGFRGTVGGRTWDRGEFGAGYYRFEADGSSLEYLARTSNNTWGVALSEDGYIFGSTANSRPSNFVHIPARYYQSIGMREPILPGIEDRADIYPNTAIYQVDQFGKYTAGSAHELYTARAFPRAYWNRAAFVTDPTGHLIGQFDLQRKGSAYVARNRWSFLVSRDAWLAPVQVKVGPDGALWVSDFYSLVVQHNPTPKDMVTGEGRAYETPNRDAERARIYRIAYDDAPAARRLALDKASPAALVQTLRHDNMLWRLLAQQTLVERGQSDVVPALVALLRDHTVDELGLAPGALHALWTLQGLGAIDRDATARDAVRAALHHPAAALRRAALMVLPRDTALGDAIVGGGLLPDRSAPGAMDYTVGSALLQDADPGVRLEALLVLSELPASPHVAAVLRDTLFEPRNAADAWMPDAVAIAGAKQGPDLAVEVLTRDVGTANAEALAGLGRAVTILTRHHAAAADATLATRLIEAASAADGVRAKAVLTGLAEGWPDERPPALTPAQRATLTAAAARMPADARPLLVKISERWGLPDVFPTP
jgi:putative membrane-bound dehydrogenase-like protein